MYEMCERVRFSETDESGRLSMSGLLRLFEDCGYFHAKARGQANCPSNKSPVSWYLIKWHIESYEMPLCGEEIKIGTWIYSNGGSIAHKQLALLDSLGRTLALGDTTWVCVDIKSGEPALPDEGVWLEEDFGEKLPLKRPLKRIEKCDLNSPETLALHHSTVSAQMLDINHHANNVLFTEYAMKLCGSSACKYLAAEFLKQAKPDDVLCPYVSQDLNGKTVTVCNSKSVPYALFRFE